MEYEPAIELYYFLGLKAINKIVELYSSGQKKKLTLVSLLIGNSQI
jgi:ABC-type multidrug transport system ATPase subunit